MTTTPKRQRITNLRLSEISSVDNPAQIGAVAVLMKRGEGLQIDIQKNAADVASGGSAQYSVLQYEDAMLRRAEELAKDYRTTPEQALAKGLSIDRQLMDLANAYNVARVSAYQQDVRKRFLPRAV